MKYKILSAILFTAVMIVLTVSLCSAGQSKRICIILIPEEMDQDIFMEQTGWDLLSVQDGIETIVITCDWNEEETASRYYASVYDELQYREDEELQIYLAGYEDGADFAAYEAAFHSSRYSGLIMLGGNGISDEKMELLKNDTDREALSVWIISPDKTPLINSNLVFWKDVNGITDISNISSYRTEFADELYLPDVSTAGSITPGSDRMGILLFSCEDDYYDRSVTESIVHDFIRQVETDHAGFEKGITGGELLSIEDSHFTYNRMQFDGQQRDYWIYVPDTVRNGTEPGKMIICLHGRGETGEDMIFLSQWHLTAAENNCIIVYPSSLYISYGQHDWQNTPEELSFLRMMTENICNSYNVDRSRMYVNGFSNGSGMAQNLVIRCADLFAAAVLSPPTYFEKEYYGPVSDPHESAVMYIYGTDDEYLYTYDMTAEIDGDPAVRKLQYWEMMYGFEHGSYHVTQEGIFTKYSYYSLNNIPVCIWIKAEGRHHVYSAEDVPMYYKFMSHYTKDVQGQLYYDGRPVVSRLTIGCSWDEYTGVNY